MARIRPILSGICRTDLELVAGYKGYRGILGHEFVGVVESAPDPAWVGKRVVAEINRACGECSWCRSGGDDRHCPHRKVLGIKDWDGAFADFLEMPIENLREVPPGVSDRQAVFTEPLAAAYSILETVPMTKETRVLGVGDGRLGLLTAQALRPHCNLLWAGRHKEKLARLKELPTCLIDEVTGQFDVVIDCTGNPDGLALCQTLVQPRGTLVIKTTTAAQRQLDANDLVVREIRVQGSRCGRFEPALQALQAGRIDTDSLISAVFPLEQGVEAMEEAAKKGVLKVLLEHDEH